MVSAPHAWWCGREEAAGLLTVPITVLEVINKIGYTKDMKNVNLIKSEDLSLNSVLLRESIFWQGCCPKSWIRNDIR